MEHLNNLPPFYVGQKVVYITGINMPKNSVHTVFGLTKFNCGCYAIDVGMKRKDNNGKMSCYYHGEIGRNNVKSAIDWIHSTSFQPIQEQTFPLISMKKVLEEQLVCSN